jgi:succinyl-CoA synthetase beta subunit
MNIHEYQGKEILASYGVRIQRGIVANSPRSGCCCKTINNRNGYKLVCCKAQVHAVDVERWWSKLAKKLTTSRRDFRANHRNARLLLKLLLKVKVHKVLIAEDVYYPGESETSEFYVSVLLNIQVVT